MAPAGSGGGNTISPPHGKAKRCTASKRWAFTWNNYPQDWVALLAPAFDGAKWIGGLEVGENGTRHVQGYVEFPIKVRPVGYKGIPTSIHWEKARKSRETNVAYCAKEATTIKGNLRLPRVPKFPEFNKPWQVEALDVIKTEPDDRTIYWYWSHEGKLGKTTFAKYLAIEHNACILAGKGADVRNGALTYKRDAGRYPDLCVFPIPRSFNSDYLSYEAIENVKDALFYSGKYEGGTVADACPHLFVFANFPPDETRMSTDRWVIKNIDENDPAEVGIGYDVV